MSAVIDTTTKLGGFIAWLVAIALAAAVMWIVVLGVRWFFAARRKTADALDYVLAVSCAGASLFGLAVLVLVV